MSNLISANVDIGLTRTLDMAYHENLLMRAVFMRILTNVLNQGTEFEDLSETVRYDRYEKLVDVK